MIGKLWRRYWNVGRIPARPVHWGREHYIPLKPAELIERLVRRERDLAPSEQINEALFREFCHNMIDLVHHQYRSHQKQAMALYEEFDPDRDVPQFKGRKLESGVSQAQRDGDCRLLFSEIADTLHHANYRRLKPREIQEAIRAASEWGVKLRIRFSSFRRLEVYARGDIVSKRWKRDWYRLFRVREVDVPIYQRLFVVFRTKEFQSLPELHDPECVHIRLFKNIPKADVDMMLPGTQVRLTWLDTGKIGIPTVWGMVMLVSKLAKSIWLLALLSAVKALSSFMLVIAIVVASLIYGIKSIFSYSTAKRRYQLNIAQNLYYQNLDNNLGALLRLIEESEQQEACEAILAYYAMLRSPNTVMSQPEIDKAVEYLLKEITGNDIDFDVEDATRDLADVGVLVGQTEGWKAVELIEAINKWTTDKGLPKETTY